MLIPGLCLQLGSNCLHGGSAVLCIDTRWRMTQNEVREGNALPRVVFCDIVIR
jgi:hypothetical protein